MKIKMVWQRKWMITLFDHTNSVSFLNRGGPKSNLHQDCIPSKTAVLIRCRISSEAGNWQQEKWFAIFFFRREFSFQFHTIWETFVPFGQKLFATKTFWFTRLPWNLLAFIAYVSEHHAFCMCSFWVVRKKFKAKYLCATLWIVAIPWRYFIYGQVWHKNHIHISWYENMLFEVCSRDIWFSRLLDIQE